jgi:hypothetical protein
VELHVANDVRLPAPGRLEELVEWCRIHLTGHGFETCVQRPANAARTGSETGRPNTEGEG